MSEPVPVPSPDDRFATLDGADRARIRAEMRYAALVISEAKETPRKSAFDKLLTFLSNGFVLLLVGSILSTFLVPRFQQYYEGQRQQAALMQECLTQFLQYGNSIWTEYYAILPLTQAKEIDREEYLKYVNLIAQVKLKRYEAYARVRALALVFREARSNAPGDAAKVDATLEAYAVRLNLASAAIDEWLRNLYCTPFERKKTPCDTFDRDFDAFAEYEKIKNLVLEIGNQDVDDVARLMVRRIRDY